ncbi:MAG: GTPase Era [Deltaproteobacteria bacterium]|nr:GTPase Era [Deltaproteobacteria bacterium]
MSFKSGFISIIGRPNAGKSTLLNAILGEKISIVSEKPQTTRNVIRGVKNLKDAQVIFIDTPGIHKGKGLLNEFMVKEALSTLREVDAIVYLVEANRPVTDDDRFIIMGLKGVKCPVILGINKVDKIDRRMVLPLIEEYSKLYPFKEIVPISALKKDGIDVLFGLIAGLLPEGPQYFPEDAITDVPERFIAAEIIREKIFRFTKEEVPYSVAVVIERFEEKRAKDLISISAAINVEKDSQKGIIIGKAGSMLKRIGTAAREDLERLLGARVYIELFVRVQEDWTKKPGALKEFGY